jgi:hypothetical protein
MTESHSVTSTGALPVMLPKAVADAVNKVAKEIQKLDKDSSNHHARYDYASIDKFLEDIGPKCAEHGLIILQDEIGASPLEGVDKLIMEFKYNFWLAHTSGEIAMAPLRRTVHLPMVGPQTSGQAQSYALKMLMRSLFRVPTGEPDGDDVEPVNVRKAPPPKAMPKPSLSDAEAKTLLNDLKDKLNAVVTDDALEKVAREIAPASKKLSDEARQDLMETYRARRDQILGFKTGEKND